MTTKEEKITALRRLGIIINIYHIVGVMQMYFFITSIMASVILNIILSTGFLWWFSRDVVKYQIAKQTILEELDKKE